MIKWALALALFVVPVLEILVLGAASMASNFLTVILLCATTAGAGWWLMRAEDYTLMTLIVQELKNDRLPTEELLDATLIWGSGVLLLVPGILTDACGFALVLPLVRESAVTSIREAMKQSINVSPHT